MLGNILVPLDGSELAEAALPFARVIASRSGAKLMLVRAARYRSLFGDVATQQHNVISRAEDYLGQVTAKLTAQGLTVETGVPFGGSPAEWIVEEAKLRHVDLIVMATHDRSGPDRWAHGSVAEDVVHRTSVPVMLVRPADAALLAERFEADQPALIVPLDGSELADSALPFATELSHAAGARLVLVTVQPAEGQLVAGQGGAIVTYTGSAHAQLTAEASSYLQRIVARLGAGAEGVETVIRYGDAATEITSTAREYAAAAIVMATHGRTGLVRSVLGSVAGGVLHHSGCPLVLFHPRGLGTAEQPVVQQAKAPSAD